MQEHNGDAGGDSPTAGGGGRSGRARCEARPNNADIFYRLGLLAIYAGRLRQGRSGVPNGVRKGAAELRLPHGACACCRKSGTMETGDDKQFNAAVQSLKTMHEMNPRIMRAKQILERLLAAWREKNPDAKGVAEQTVSSGGETRQRIFAAMLPWLAFGLRAGRGESVTRLGGSVDTRCRPVRHRDRAAKGRPRLLIPPPLTGKDSGCSPTPLPHCGRLVRAAAVEQCAGAACGRLHDRHDDRPRAEGKSYRAVAVRAAVFDAVQQRAGPRGGGGVFVRRARGPIRSRIGSGSRRYMQSRCRRPTRRCSICRSGRGWASTIRLLSARC